MFATEMWGDTLVVFSGIRKNNDDEPQLLGKSSASKVTLDDGHCGIVANLEIRPYCEPCEIEAVKGLLLTHMLKKMDK
jgi:hypothetical protein